MNFKPNPKREKSIANKILVLLLVANNLTFGFTGATTNTTSLSSALELRR